MRVRSSRSGILALGAALMAGALVVAGLDEDAASQVQAGACVAEDTRPADCGDAAAVYRVLTTVKGGGAGCPRGDYFERSVGSDVLCLGYNVAPGDCVQDNPDGPALVRCTTDTRTPTFRILQVVEDRASAKACRDLDGDAVLALRYTVPAKTLCIVHLPLAPVPV